MLTAKTPLLLRVLLPGLIALSALGLPAVASGPVPVAAAAPTTGLRILQSTATSMLVELTVDAFVTETVSIDGQTYQRLTLPDFGQSTQPGAPQVPQRTALLGLPSTAGVQVQLEDQQIETVGGLRLAPAPTLQIPPMDMDMGPASQSPAETLAFDPQIYSANAFYPAQLAQLGQVGLFRDQPVAQLQFNPVQYNPATGQTRIAHRLLARLTWSAATSPTAAARAASPQFENVLRQSLLNYDTLSRPSISLGAAPASPQLFATGTITPELKINITSTGIYTLSFAAITAAGFNLNGIDAGKLMLMHRGLEVPIQIIGQQPGASYNPQAYLLFYAVAYEDVYTNVDVYWLEAGGAPGLRMASIDSPPGGAPTPGNFPVDLHAEVNQNYWSNMPNGTGQDHWFWGTRLSPDNYGLATYRDYSDTMSYPPAGCNCLTLHNLATGPLTATVTVRLRGYTTTAHHTQIDLNGVTIADSQWSGQGLLDLTSVVSQSLLVNGSNMVRVRTILADPDSSVPEQILVDYIEINYRDRYVAVNNSLTFGAPSAAAWTFAVSGFTRPGATVFDVTNPEVPVQILDAAVTPTNPYTVTFQTTATTASRYLALTPDQFKSPASIALDQPSNWHATTNGADWIVITPHDFYTEAVSLANLRQSQGLRVAVVDVQDLYDEFNDGIFNPQAIRDFLAYTYSHWQAPAPTYVVLLGDGCQDYKNALWDVPTAACPEDFVPPHLYESNLSGQVASDDWYVDFNGNDLFPDMLIGRISVQTPQQADDAVAKIISYDQSPPPPVWNHTVTLVAGGDDPNFSNFSDQISNTVSAGYTVNRLYMANIADPNSALYTAFNNGSLLLNYLGHGEFDRWGTYNGSIVYLNTSNIPALGNVGKLAVVTIGDCLNGAFSGPVMNTSMAEVFQRATNQGAVAVFAPADLGFSTGHRLLMTAFYQAIFANHLYGLGAAVAAAKVNVLNQSSGWAGMVQTYIFFGDPATTLGRAAAPQPKLFLPLLRR